MEDERSFKYAFDIEQLKRSLLSAAQDAKDIEKRNNIYYFVVLKPEYLLLISFCVVRGLWFKGLRN